MILHIFLLNIFLIIFQWQIKQISTETVSGCTINNNNRRINNDKTSVTLSCANNGYILVKNLTFGVHKTSSFSTATTATSSCTYQPGDCTTRTTYIGMECNGLTTCDLDLNPQYLHICSQYSDYMVLDYSCLQGPSLSVCSNRLISTSLNKDHRLFLRSPNYPHEYENSLNCSCQINTIKSSIKFLDFYLEERDEMNICSRDYLQINNRSYCGSSIDDNNNQMTSSISFDSSFQLIFKTNDVITRKGFWVMINSQYPLQVSCNNLIDLSSTIITTTTEVIQDSTSTSVISLTKSSSFNLSNNNNNDNNNSNNPKRRHTLSYILILTTVFVVVLLLLNVLLIILCWRQRRPKTTIDSKTNDTNRPFFCSIRSSASSSSSITYGETPVLTSLDTQKQQTLSTRYIYQSNKANLDTTPSTSTTTATGPYEDLNDSISIHRQYNKPKLSDSHSPYIQHRPMFSSPNTAYNRMIHFPPVPIRCHLSSPVQTFYPPQPFIDSQHIYETIQDGHCPYQRLAATLRRQQQQQHQPQCTCYYDHNEQNYPIRTLNNEHLNTESTPETLV
ncbi:unnamed protein product [Adineta steineri]|uniref:CUB domain-containing protein n=1 Tax=Adineta steineri TaxID=433720 RepID=A0A815VVG0_9BILA|nr:unnamed protein product [Adineta steineri]CAF1537055.1 unnamed protein product [Adineta steineri]